MTTLLQLLLLIVLVSPFIYRRASLKTVLIASAVVLVLFWLFWDFSLLLWLLLGVVVFFSLMEDLRLSLLTKPIFKLFKSALPSMSETERDAIEAGDVWWEGELFRGSPDWKTLWSYPKPELTEEEQAYLDNQTQTLCSMLDDWAIVHRNRDLSAKVWKYIKKEKFLGMIIPKEYGGLGFSALAHSAVVTRIASCSASAAVNVMVPNSLGPAELLMQFGTQEQRDQYLPKLAIGEEIPCFALTSPEAGSDAGSLIDSGIVCKGEYNGEEVLGIKLTWNKRYITLAPIATVLGLAFKLYDPDNLLGEETELGITVALIPTDHPGVETGRRHDPMSMAFMNGPTRGKDVFIPMDWIIGGADNAGKGWKMLVTCLSEGRGISLPALSAATAELCYGFTGAYSSIRQQFNVQISQFEGVEEALARIAGYTYMIEASRQMTAGAVDLHVKPAVVSAIAKYHMTELARVVVRNAMDVHGGKGLILGPKNYLAHSYISTPIAITVEGANILTRNLIIFGQGAIRCHPYVYKEMLAAQNPNTEEALKDFDREFFAHVGYSITNIVRTLGLGLNRGWFVEVDTQTRHRRAYQKLTRISSALSMISDMSMLVLGGSLKRKERLSARLGDILSQLYLASAVLKYHKDHGEPESEDPYVQWSIQTCLYECQLAFDGFFANFPNRFLAAILKRIVFPFGHSFKPPTDALAEKIVEPMLSHNPIREKLTRHLFVGDKPEDASFQIEHAFKLVQETKAIRAKIRTAAKAGTIDRGLPLEVMIEQLKTKQILSESEIAAYQAAEEARSIAIQVDDFAAKDLK